MVFVLFLHVRVEQTVCAHQKGSVKQSSAGTDTLCVCACVCVCINTRQCWDVCIWLRTLGQGVVELALLQTIEAISPGGGRHTPVGVQQDPEASHNEDEEENKEEDDQGKSRLLLQGHGSSNG